MTLRIIGDVHGRIREYLALTAGADESIQIGDMGLGFKGVSLPPMSPGHGWFRGNHDSPQVCRAHKNYLGDWGYDAEKELFWFSGADSIDKHLRREGVSWWHDEELSVAEFERALELYEQVKPRIVLSHDGPQNFIRAAFGIHKKSRTRQALQAAYELHQPALWIYGHHHVRREFQSPEGTYFICLPELGWIDLELPLPPRAEIAEHIERCHAEKTEADEERERVDDVVAAVKSVVDMTDRRAKVLARVCLQNGGRLSKAKRKKFAELIDEDVEQIEKAIEVANQDSV